jgi:hypothetical protein
MLYRWLFTLLSLAVACSVGFGESFTVTVKATDADKKPVAKADVALFWNVKDGAMTPAAEKPVVTDADGKAVLRVEDWNEKRAVLVLSADRKLGGIVGVSKDDDGKEAAVTLGPTTHVKGKLECKELNFKPEWVNTTITADGFRAFFTQDISKSAAFEFVLPAGKYTFHSYGTDVEDFKQTVTFTADQRECDLGVIDMKASPIAKLKGKTPPEWVIADARGVKKDVKLADCKGKWVYVEFWGFW